MRAHLALVTLLALAPAALAAQQQQRPLRLSRFSAGFEGGLAQPVGAFADEVGTFGGGALFGQFRLTHALSLRAEANILVYGHQRIPDLCASTTCRVRFDVTTDNQVFSGLVGPQLELPRGPIRPYIGAGLGLGYFFTSSGVAGSSNGAFATTDNYHDAVLAWTGGGGVRVPFRIRRVPLAVDFGARYQQNGTVSYLRKGEGITDNPDGSITVHPTTSAANFVLWHLGASVTIPRGR